MRVQLNNIPAFIRLSGEDRFKIDQANEHDLAILLGNGSLHFRPNERQPADSDVGEPGCLVITNNGTGMTVRLDGHAGAYTSYWCQLSDGVLQEGIPGSGCAVDNWQLIFRALDGRDIVLFSIGPSID